MKYYEIIEFIMSQCIYVIIWLIIKMIIEVNYNGMILLRVYINFKRVIKELFLVNY